MSPARQALRYPETNSVWVAYWRHARDWRIALTLAVPLLVIYELGLLVVGWDALNGADYITIMLLKYLGRSGFVVFNVGLLAGFAVAVFYFARSGRLQFGFFVPLLLESAFWAGGMGTVIILAMEQAHLLGPTDLQSTSVLTRIVISAGAG